MKNIDLGNFLRFLLLILVITGCCRMKDAENYKTQMPQEYPWVKDTASIADINWRNYYKDSVLIHLIDTALNNNLDLKIALQHIEMARANVRSAKGLSFPVISATGSASVQKYGKYTMNGAGNNGLIVYNNQVIPENLPDYNLGLQTSWEIDLWGKIRNKKNSAVANFLASVEGKNLVVTSLVSEIANNYYELLALDNKLDIIRESIYLQDSAFKIVTVQKEAGAANELAVKQFEAKLLDSKELELETLQKISESENNLNLLLNRFPQPIARDKKVMASLIPAEIKAGIPSDLLKSRPDIRQSELQLIAAKADVKSARAAFFPSLNITGAYGYDAFKTSLFFSPQSIAFNAAGGLIAPLINRSALQAEFKTAKASQLEALYNYQKSILNGYMEVYNQLLNYKNSAKLLELKSKEVDILNLATTSSIDLFRTGRANYLEVITTQQDILQSKMELIDAQKQQCEAVIGIYKALGGGWK